MKRRSNPNRSKRPRDTNLQTAVTEDTLQNIRVQAAAQGMSVSAYVYQVLKLATNNFNTLNLTDIENSIKKENEK